MRSDDELMAGYLSGDRPAFDELFRRHAPPLLLSLRRRLNLEDANDVVQQTFLQLHRSRFDYDPSGAGVRAWLTTIAFNLQRRYARRAQPHEAASEDISSVGDPLVWPEDDLAAQSVRTAVSQLPREQQRVIALHWFEGLPFEQVAKAVGASLSAVKVRAHRGYNALRKTFQRDKDG